MINAVEIKRNLDEIEARYDRHTDSPRDPLYYSKLALIELCGWIEESMDAVVRDCAKKSLNEVDNISYIEDSVIRRNFSFAYDRHFRSMLIQVLGMPKVEELEGMLDSTKFEAMKSGLDYLKRRRDSLAHTYVSNVTQNVDSPSRLKSYFQTVHDGLIDLEQCILRLNT